MPWTDRLRIAAPLIVTAGLLSAINAATATASPASPTREGSLVFARSGGLYVLSMHSRRIERLTRAGGAVDREPALSPGGTLLAYERVESGTSRVLVRSLVSGQTTVVGAGRSPAFAPGGREIAFATEHGLAIADLGALQQRPLTDDPADDHPAWSALGEIAFTRPEPSGRAVYSVRPDGTGPERIAWIARARAFAERPHWSTGRTLLVQVSAHPTCPAPRSGMATAPGVAVAITSCARQAVWAPGGRAFAELYTYGLGIVSTRGRLLGSLCHLDAAPRRGLAWSDSPALAALARKGPRRDLGCRTPRLRRRGVFRPVRRGTPRGARGHTVICWRLESGKRKCVSV